MRKLPKKRALLVRPPEPDYNMRRDGVSATLLLDFIQCREMAKVSVEGWRPAIQPAPMQFGSLAHEVLHDCYSFQKVNKKRPKRGFVLKAIETVCAKTYDKFGSRWSDRELNLLEFQKAQMAAVLPAYFEYWDDAFDWVALEEWFEQPVGDTFVKGRMDGAFHRKKELWIFETKTSSRIEEDAITETLERDFQGNVYELVAFYKYGVRPNGRLQNFIRRPGQEQKKSESLDEYEARVAADVADRPDHYFKRFEVPSTKKEQLAFSEEFHELLEEFNCWVKEGFPTRRFGMPCQNKYGLCRNVPICYRNDLGRFIQIRRKDAKA